MTNLKNLGYIFQVAPAVKECCYLTVKLNGSFVLCSFLHLIAADHFRSAKQDRNFRSTFNCIFMIACLKSVFSRKFYFTLRLMLSG